MSYNFDKIVDRRGTNSIKWESINGGSNNHLLPLWIADMDFRCPEPVIEAINLRVEKGIFGYSTPLDGYYDSVKNWFSKRFEWEINTEDIVKSPGVVPALSLLIKAFTKEGQGVIIQRPVYHPFTFLITNNGRKLVNNSLINKDGKYFIDFEDLEMKAKDSNNKMLILCSPHNPVGRVWTKEELTRLTKICLENDVIIVSDEIHCDLVRPGVKHIPVAKISGDKRIITCTAPSKSFNMAGLQMANIIIKDKKMREQWEAEFIGKSGLMGTNPISICATEAAYKQCEDWLENVNIYIENNLLFVKEFLDENLPKTKFLVPEGTFFAWVDFGEYARDHKELEKIMIDEAGVALSEGYAFGEEGNCFERINVACSREILENGLNKIKNALVK